MTFYYFNYLFVDKSTMSLDANEDGFLAKILVEEGTKDVPINKV
jgi:pyruvate/2-oxoglutarate dehydrogenase complex dihydrolipoamide acyltransferase (E2) component